MAWPGAAEWGKKNEVDPKDAIDIFHGIKGRQKGKPGSKAKDVCTVNPDTGEVFGGQGEYIGDLNDPCRRTK